MPMNEKDLKARDAKRDIGTELLEAVRLIKAGQVGRTYQVQVPMALEARQRLGLSQSQFATVLGVSPRTLQDWEQQRRQPSGAARTLMKIAALRPDVVRDVINESEGDVRVGDTDEKALPALVTPPARPRRGQVTMVFKTGKVVRGDATKAALVASVLRAQATKAPRGAKVPFAGSLRVKPSAGKVYRKEDIEAKAAKALPGEATTAALAAKALGGGKAPAAKPMRPAKRR